MHTRAYTSTFIIDVKFKVISQYTKALVAGPIVDTKLHQCSITIINWPSKSMIPPLQIQPMANCIVL